MNKEELTLIGLYQYTDSWYYTSDWNFAFDPIKIFYMNITK